MVLRVSHTTSFSDGSPTLNQEISASVLLLQGGVLLVATLLPELADILLGCNASDDLDERFLIDASW